MINCNFPKYGEFFWCIDEYGNKLSNPDFPILKPFLYLDKNGNLDGDAGWLLLKSFSIIYKIDKKWYKITCKEGFDYDGASIPQAVRSIMGDKMSHDIIVAALFHDILYCVHNELLPKDKSDLLLINIMSCYNSPDIKCKSVLCGVKYFGSSAWNKDAELKKQRYLPFFEIKEIEYENGQVKC